mgnify:CR=1 FL=1
MGASLTVLKQAPVQYVESFPPSNGGCVKHPVARQANLQPLLVCGAPPNYQLLTALVPLSSIFDVHGQIALTVGPLLGRAGLTPGATFPVWARAMFALGVDPLDDPAVDPPIFSHAGNVSAWIMNTITIQGVSFTVRSPSRTVSVAG